MQMHKVKSSQIKEIGHNPETNTMAVRFNSGGLYHYAGVDAKKFSEFKGAESVGSHFAKHIKGAHDFTKINEKKGEK